MIFSEGTFCCLTASLPLTHLSSSKGCRHFPEVLKAQSGDLILSGRKKQHQFKLSFIQPLSSLTEQVQF